MRQDEFDISTLDKGKLLLAEPFMMDPNFQRGAVMLTDCRQEGVVGFVINRRLDVPVQEVISDFPDFKDSLYFGGPVSTDTIYYVHRRGDIVDNSLEIMNGLYWGGDYEKVKFLIQQELITPRDIRFFIGYSGWSQSQLADEMSVKTWMVTDMHPNYLFKSRPDSVWRQVLTHMGSPYTVIAQMPESPCLN